MKKYPRVLSLIVMTFSLINSSKPVLASEQDQSYGNWGKPFGAEIWDCRMNDNVTLTELNQALDQYGTVLKKLGLKEFEAAIWTPIYATMPNVERSVFWFGHWPLEVDGKAIDTLQANSTKISDILEPVITCGSKVYYWGWDVYKGLEADEGANKIVNVQHCTYKTEWDNLRGQLNAKTDSDLLAANKRLKAYAEKNDLIDINAYQLWPNTGFSFIDPMRKYDFIWINEYKSFTQFSERNRRLVYEFDYWTLYSEVISPLIDCNTQQAFTARKILGSSS